MNFIDRKGLHVEAVALDCRTILGPYVKLTVGMRYCWVFKRPLSAQQLIESATIAGQILGIADMAMFNFGEFRFVQRGAYRHIAPGTDGIDGSIRVSSMRKTAYSKS